MGSAEDAFDCDVNKNWLASVFLDGINVSIVKSKTDEIFMEALKIANYSQTRYPFSCYKLDNSPSTFHQHPITIMWTICYTNIKLAINLSYEDHFQMKVHLVKVFNECS